MPQEKAIRHGAPAKKKKKRSPGSKLNARKAKKAALASIALREESGRSEPGKIRTPRTRRKLREAADRQLSEAIRINKETREISRKSRKK